MPSLSESRFLKLSETESNISQNNGNSVLPPIERFEKPVIIMDEVDETPKDHKHRFRLEE